MSQGHQIKSLLLVHFKSKLREIGADNFVVSTDPESMKKAAGSLDLILNTVSHIILLYGFLLADIVQWQVSAEHDLSAYLGLLARKGVIVQLGLVTSPHPVAQLPLMFKKISIAGSLIGGLPETQASADNTGVGK